MSQTVEIRFNSFRESLTAFWKFIRKDQVTSSEIINWFYERGVTIKGNPILGSKPLVSKRYDPLAGDKSPHEVIKVFMRRVSKEFKNMGVICSPETKEHFLWKRIWHFKFETTGIVAL